MTQDDEAWRSIVENYGERAVLDDEPDTTTAERSETPGPSETSWTSEPSEPSEDRDDADEPELAPWAPGRDHGFVPPPTPPVDVPPPARLAAWTGVLGVPLLCLLLVLVRVHVPGLLATAMVAWFLGGFGYLVWQMPRGRDPFDDGARL